MSISLNQEARQKITQWVQLYKLHKPFQSIDVNIILQQQKPQQNPHNKFYMLLLKHVANLKVPPPQKQKNELSAIRAGEVKEKNYFLQMKVTLFNPQTGFFGRTYRGKQIPLRLVADTQELIADESDWAVFYTRSEAKETKAVVEVIIVEAELAKNIRNSRGIGYAIVPLFYDDMPITAEILKGSPRDVMKNANDPGMQPPHEGSILYFELSKQEKKFDQLMSLVPDNILLGCNDDLPGIQGSKLPIKSEELATKAMVSKLKTIYAHNIRISSMNEVEEAFQLYLKDWKKFQQNAEIAIEHKAEIVERRLTVVPHNSWRNIGSQSFVSLNREIKGVIQSSGALKILNFPLHPLVSLIFKLEYRIQFVSVQGKNESKDFVLGWCIFVPNLNDVGDNIKDEEVQLDLILGPGMTLFGDVLWDQSLVRKQRKLFVKMAIILTTSEDLVSETEKKKQEDMIIQQAQKKVEKQLKTMDEEKKKEQEQLRKLQEENDKLRKEREILEQQNKKPPEELLKQNQSSIVEIERQKELYKSKNEEIEELIEQVIKSQQKDIPKEVKDQGEQSVASLLRFLIQMVMQNYGPEEQHMSSEIRREVTKKNLLELLKSDTSFKMNVFGSQGGMSVLNCKELSRQDKVNLLRMGVGKNLLDPETEAKLLASEPRMEVELHDPYKASTISFKFVAIKTPITFSPDVQIPSKLYFTFKFFTFKTVQTDKVMLKMEGRENQQPPMNLSEQNQNVKIKLGAQYLLQKLNIEQDSLEASLQIIFDIDPTISGIPEEPLYLARYMKDRILTIDLWNGDSLMHFGTCKIPLHFFLRQGDPSKVIGQEYDICEPEHGGYVGGLQLLISNEGRKIPLQEQSPSKGIPPAAGSQTAESFFKQQKHKKKVLSKPLDSVNFDNQLSNLAQTYEFTKQNQTTMLQSEEARKKLRVERLKRMTVNQESMAAVGKQSFSSTFNDPGANEWDKLNSLKQIEMIRESKKHNLLNKVLKESLSCKQTLEVISGQPSLVHFLVSNPFPQDEVFQIVVQDPEQAVTAEPELQLVHNEQLEWQFWFNENKCNRPSEWDIVSSKYDLLLRSGQQCPLLFKFLSFREPVSEGSIVSSKAEIQGMPPSAKELRSRKMKITILSKDQMPVQTLELKIIPREQYCDQIFRYYEPQSTKTYIKIPRFVPFQLNGMTIHVSNKDMKADINPEGEIFIITQTEHAPRKTDGFVYVYQDKYCSQLLACCKVEIYALQCIRQKVQAGPETIYQLQVRSTVKRTIEIFSSNPRLVFPPGRKERNLQILQPNDVTVINIGVKASTSGIQRARIHCVDINTKELIQAWLFEIEADKPLLQKAYQIQTVVGRHTPYKFPYSNSLNEFITLEFVSSKPSLMEVRREKEGFDALQNKHIDLYVPPQNRVGQEEVILYINDESNRISESLLFKIIVKE